MSDQPETRPEAPAPGNPPDTAAEERETAAPLTGGQKAWLALRVVLKRVRFLAILLLVGMFIGYWDTVKNYWDKWTRPQRVAVRQLEPGQEFFCPMHPNVVRSSYEPNGDVPQCPICGMPLSARKKGEKEALPPGITGRVQLTPERIQLAGIQTVTVANRPIDKQVTTVGYLAFDESRLSRVVTRVSGYVEKLYVDKTYVTVREGDPLAEIYSPELYNTAQELVLALQSDVSKDLAGSARDRLRLFGVSDKEIDDIARSGKASPRLVIRSPQSGYVIDRGIVAGASLERGTTLLEVADLSAVWIEAEVYEKDVAFLQVGQPIEARVQASSQRTFAGRLALIYPRLEAATRTNRVRFELANPNHQLRPGMFATVTIQTSLQAIEPFRSVAGTTPQVMLTSASSAERTAPAEFPVVPERAVVDTGLKKVVYVERAPGLFEGVEVELGPRVTLQDGPRLVDYYPVLAGLRLGDRVAAAGAFLIDAETRLNPAAAATYFGASGSPQSSARIGSQGPQAAHPGTESPAAKDSVKSPPAEEPSDEDLANVAQLPDGDRQQALQQRWCPVTGKPLGSMGVPYKITLRDQTVWLCCKGCVSKAKRSPDEMLAKIRREKE
jgi:Cu(I)/Ag(I) efflux system membrane fusion protein